MAPETTALPDVAQQLSTHGCGLAWVGMSDIELPVRIDDVRQSARADAFVDLVPGARGIHMSRLYLHLDERLGDQPLSPALIGATLEDFLSSHRDLSTRAKLGLRFAWMTRRSALVSDKSGWRSYPVALHATLDGQSFSLVLETHVSYSSTCPCSAALARRLIQQQFDTDFARPLRHDEVREWLGSERGIGATPHSQRSTLTARVALSGNELPMAAIVDALEKALATPVQTAVKREDEQAFARLNGSNLMFCEDAARRAFEALDRLPFAADFWLRAAHHESLHPHDAVAVAVKGVAGGFSP